MFHGFRRQSEAAEIVPGMCALRQQEARSLKEPLRKALDEFHAPDSPPVPSRRLSPRRLLPQFTSSGDIIANGPTVSGDTTGEPVQGVGVCDVTVGAPGRWYELKAGIPNLALGFAVRTLDSRISWVKASHKVLHRGV